MNKLKIALAVAATLGAGNTIAANIAQNGATSLHTVSSVAAGLTNVVTGTVANVVAATGGERTLQQGDIITIEVTGAKFDRTNLGANPVTLTDGAVATWVLDATDSILTGTVTTQSATDNTANTMTLTGVYDITLTRLP